MRTLIAFILLFLSSTSCAAFSKHAVDINGQSLTFSVPSSWGKEVGRSNGPSRSYHFFPKGQSVQQHSEILSVYLYPDLHNNITSNQMMSMILKKIEAPELCKAYKYYLFYPKISPNDMTDTAALLFYCTSHKNHANGMVSYYVVKRMNNKNDIFVIYRSWQGQSFLPSESTEYHLEHMRKLAIFVQSVHLTESVAPTGP